ncbi:hypothetical protein [Mesorhizobium sp. B2-8-5]|uniref:hypothetical protein n=1 Tax=Mesorhizobium sp. B2-8-5 TaxID=2589903 RepID=UPI001AEED687|nr:hypothetical protein [Mesorhizobium sp. B2-8-5]UCI23721.1 hypothetical protein FJ430_19085 [Mesorhizobium sp. B2-8-5]
MTDRPILFSGPMVRALLEGRKTQTRRVLGRLRRFGAVTEFGRSDTRGYDWHFRDKQMRWNDLRHSELLEALPFSVGDRLYVREAHHRTNDSAQSHLVGYDFADGPIPREERHHIASVGDVQFFRHSLGGWGGRTSRNYPALHMPRWASRLTLTVTDVRVQRLQEISEADAIAEGIQRFGRFYAVTGDEDWDAASMNARDGYALLWDSLNAARGFGWDVNPWVAAVFFIVERRNIDEVKP